MCRLVSISLVLPIHIAKSFNASFHVISPKSTNTMCNGSNTECSPLGDRAVEPHHQSITTALTSMSKNTTKVSPLPEDEAVGHELAFNIQRRCIVSRAWWPVFGGGPS